MQYSQFSINILKCKMNSFEVIIFVCATFVSVTGILGENLECPQICPDLLDPVCGTDGNEYAKFDNHCELNMFNCKRQRSTLSSRFSP